jgi:hypothetical protein
MSFDRETIGAFVDGELDEIRRRRIEAELQRDPELARRVEAEQRLRDALKARFAPIAEEPVPERLVAAVRDGAKVETLRSRRRFMLPVAIAASVAAVAVVGLQLRPGADPNLASGPLAQALETQLASAQAVEAPVRIGITFRSNDGSWCRTFEQRTGSGIACRSNEGWRLRRFDGQVTRSGEYRQASGPAVAAAAQDMAAEPPVEAQRERELVASGWKR